MTGSTVWVVEDERPMRESLTLLLETHGFAVRAYGSAEAMLADIDAAPIGCALLDVRLPGQSGLDLLKLLKGRGYALESVMISGHGDIPMAVEAVKAGALHFVEKPFDPEALVEIVGEAVRQAERTAVDADEAASIRGRYESLTTREREILGLVSRGLSSKLVAIELGISPRTVDNHRASIMVKMGAKNVSSLVRMSMMVQEPQRAR